MALQVGYNTVDFNRNKKWGKQDGNPIERDPSEESSTEGQTQREELLATEGWQTPQEYYANMANSEASPEEYSETEPVNAGDFGTTIPIYFWIEEFKNWGTYSMFETFVNNNSMMNVFQLYLWNGRDGWCAVNIKSTNSFTLNVLDDQYKIAPLQNIFLTDVDVINQHRGEASAIQTTSYKFLYTRMDFTPVIGKYSHIGFLQLVNAIRLKRINKYGINKQNFQTLTYGSSNIYTDSSVVNVGDHTQTNFRGAVTYGCPAIWRLPTGEIALCTRLEWNVDNGLPYYYKKRGYSLQNSEYLPDYGFKKYHNQKYVTPKSVGMNSIINFESQSKSETYINEICRQFFGNGSNKTIETDWLNNNPITTNKEEYSMAGGVQGSMLDSELVFEQHNINKENSLKCSFKINRPIVTTTERPNQDYARKW